MWSRGIRKTWEHLSTCRGNLQPPAVFPLWGKTRVTRGKIFPSTHREWTWKFVNKKWHFSLLCPHSQESNLGFVIVWCKNSRVEVWVSWYLAQHVHLMWIKDYMVELSKYNQCNMIHSCPAQQMLEQMSGKKPKICWGVSVLFWISAFKRREYPY